MKTWLCRICSAAWIVASFSFFWPAVDAHAGSRVREWGYPYSSYGTNLAVPASLTNAVSAACGNGFSVVLRQDGTVVGWNSDGSLQTNVPPGLNNVVAVASAGDQTLALKADGTVVSWGYNTLSLANVPPELTGVAAIALSEGHALALRGDGTVVCWEGQGSVPDNLTNVVGVAAGWEQSLFLRADGTVVSSGTYFVVPPDLTNVVAIASTFDAFLALKADGTLVAWGDTSCGMGTVPFSATNVVAIAAGEYHFLALRADGTVVGWGMNGGGQTTVPANLTSVIAIAGGVQHSLAIQNDGAPAIARQPVNRQVYSGQSLLLNAGAVGRPPLTYSWRLKDTNYVTASGLLLLTNLKSANSGPYWVEVSSSNGSITGAPANLTVIDSAPIIQVAPTNCAAFGGTNTTFTIRATGSLPMTYQWSHDGAAIAGATNNSLALTNIQWSDVGNYTVVVSNQFGTANISATLDLIPLSISTQPGALSVLGGASASFSVTTRGNGPFTYQWSLNGTNISGATTNSLVIPSVQLTNAGNYSVLVKNSFGSIVSSNALLTLIPFQFTQQPTDQVKTPGSTASFKVAVYGQGSFGYQWQYQGTNLPFATNSTLTLTNVDPSSDGLYAVVVTNAFGTLVSSNATLTVSTVLIWGDNSGGQLTLPHGLTNILSVAAGDLHCVALKADGTLVAWGDNSFGQTNIPTDLTNVTAVAAGSAHTLAVRSNGTVAVFGQPWGSLAVVPPEATNIVALGTGPGALHALALRADGSVLDWGYSAYGLTNIPPDATNIVAVAAGSYHALALRADGRVVAWGDNSSGKQCNVPAQATNVVAIAAGWYGSAALRADGKILTWGQTVTAPTNIFTNIVDLACPFNYSSPGLLLALRNDGTVVQSQSSTMPGPITNATAVAAGSYNGLALVGDGPPRFPALPVDRKVAAGAFAYFRMPAVGAFPIRYQWSCNGTNVTGATNAVFVVTNATPDLAGNIYTVTATNALGTAVSKGMVLGVEPGEAYVRITNSAVRGGTDVMLTSSTVGIGPFTYQWLFNGTNLAGATNSSLVLTNITMDNVGAYSVIISNAFGTATSPSQALSVIPLSIITQPQSRAAPRWSTPVLSVTSPGVAPVYYQWRRNGIDLPGETNAVLTLSGVQADQAGVYSVQVSNQWATITSSNATLTVLSVVVWGDQYYLKGGVPPITSNAVAVAAGANHVLALCPDGTAVAWGDNSCGQTNTPSGLTNVVAITAGAQHSIALKSNGSIVSWGSAYANAPASATNMVSVCGINELLLGMHADGTLCGWGYTSQYETLSVPPGISNVTAVAAGLDHCAALRSDGSVIAWGDNSCGQTNTPADLTNAVGIAAGGAHTLALRSNGTVIVWGDNTCGQTNIPSDLTNVAAVAAGWSHSVALKADGTVVAWGDNYYGQTNVPPGLTNVVAISAGLNLNVALIGNGPPVRQVMATNMALSHEAFSFSLPSQSGKVYLLEYKNSLNDADWTVLQRFPGNGGALLFADPSANEGQRFYRVRQW